MWKDRATRKIRPITRSGLCNIDHSNSAMSSGRPRPSTLHKPELTALHTTSAERYLTLASAEAVAGDLVGAEKYNQHAEHYFRSMSADLGQRSVDVMRAGSFPRRPVGGM
jgi:hypothetical protein